MPSNSIFSKILIIALIITLSFLSQNALATSCPACVSGNMCKRTDCNQAVEWLSDYHAQGLDDILLNNDGQDSGEVDKYDMDEWGAAFTPQLTDFSAWLLSFVNKNIVKAMQKMSVQLTSLGMQQVMIVGSFLDAKMQLETQHAFQKLKIKTHQDYQVSEDFCQFGTNIRSLASSEQNAHYQTASLSTHQMARHLGTAGIAGAVGRDQDKAARWKQFQNNYCDPQDNNWRSTNTGLSAACNNNSETNRVNIDIDYTRLIDQPRTIDLDFETHTASTAPSFDDITFDREDIMALGNNLYGHDVISRKLQRSKLNDQSSLYMALRSIVAKRNVAQNSYKSIIELKTASKNENSEQTRAFLAAILAELGINEEEMNAYIGEKPSYYAQLEILAKSIYQNPDFYANLYDTPANVKRKNVALKTIELMVDRAIFESQLRREMATSVLLSTQLRDEFDAVNSKRGMR